MKLFRIIPYIICSYFFVFTNDGFSQCATDTLAPICIAPADIQIGTDSIGFYFNNQELFFEHDSLKIVNRFGVAESADNCTATVIELDPEYSSILNDCDKSVYRQFLATDENGNQSTCRQLIAADPAKNLEQIIQLPSLYEPFQSFISSDTFTSLGAGYFLLRQWGESEVVGNDTLVHYWFTNKCRSTSGSIPTYYLPVFDIDGDGRKGDAYTMRIANDSLYFERPNLRDSVIAFPNTNWRYTLESERPSIQSYIISGTIFADLNGNCEQELGENGIPRFFVLARSFPSRNQSLRNADSLGNYELTIPSNSSDTLIEIRYIPGLNGVRINTSNIPDLNIGQACGNSFNSFSFKIPSDTTSIQQDFAINGQVYDFSGTVFTDLNSNCAQEMGENGISNVPIIVRSFPSGATFETKADTSGNYDLIALIALSDTLFEVEYATDLNIGQACGNFFSIRKPTETTSIQQDFSINLVENCPTIAVDIGAVRLRRCFTNRYFVNYFNYSTEEIEEVSVEVELDPFLLYERSSISAIALGENRYRFPIGRLQSGESGQFYIDVEVSCEAELGQTHCVKAEVFPYMDCVTESVTWSGASIQLTAECEGDSVQLVIENAGDGSMIQESNFVVTEDVLMLRQGTFQLPAQESLTLTYPANGATYRLAADQVANHPGQSQPSISIEGCGGINTTGLVNAFPQDDQNINVSIDCQENIGSYDPNDKAAMPSGWGAENYIAKNTNIEYKIRFQNTGTDTAFKVVIVDTLSAFLDATTIIPGAASHAYTYQQQLDTSLGVSIIQFTFKDILLPDSTTNLEGSNGFVKFKIAQQPDLLDDTIIENKAAIFFDFNEPIITNTVFHTIGQPFDRIIANTKERLFSNREIVVQPNPFSESTQLSISGNPIQRGVVRLYNLLDQAVEQQSFSGNQITLQRNNLQSGLYIYAILSDNQLIATGKLQLSQQ